MVKPVHVFIDGQELTGYTDLTLSRKKDDMTGQVDLTVFMNYLPVDPVLIPATKGKQLLVYIGGYLAFTGKIDRRNDATGSFNIDQYTVKFTARGSTKYLIDSSNQEQTTTLLRTTSKDAIEKLVEPWGIEVVWEAEIDDLDKVRFRDGGRVADEIQRIAEMCSLYVYETTDGKLKVIDDKSADTGENIVLGQNVLSFSTDQAEDLERQEITVKGQRIEKGKFGDAAAIDTLSKLKDDTVPNFVPITVQLYGNGTPELLEKRAQFEANKRAVQSKRVTVDVFHVQQTSGEPWDIGDLHYVELPPAGVFDIMQVLEITYTIVNENQLFTTLVFGPAPVKIVSAETGFGGFLSDVPELDEMSSLAKTARNVSKVTFGTGAEHNWSGPVLKTTGFREIVETISRAFLDDVPTVDTKVPPTKLPSNFGE